MALLRIKDVAAKTGLSPNTVRLWSKSGKFPAPIKLGNRTFVWDNADIEKWIESKKEIV